MLYYFYIAFLVLVIILELKRKTFYPLDYLRIFTIFFLIRYAIPPIVALANPKETFRYISRVPESLESIKLFVIIVSAYFGVKLGFLLEHHSKKFSTKTRLTWKPNTITSVVKKILFLLLGLGIILSLYLYQLGGLARAISSGYAFRTGIEEKNVSGILAYLLVFLSLLQYTSLLLFALLIDKLSVSHLQKKFSTSNLIIIVLFLISVISSLVYGLSTGGRGNIILSVFPIFILLANSSVFRTILRKNYPSRKVKRLSGFYSLRKSLFYLLVASSFIVVFIIYSRPIMYAIYFTIYSSGSFWTNFSEGVEKFSGELSGSLKAVVVLFVSNIDHHFASTQLVLDFPEKYNFPRLFLDIPRSYISLVPGIHYSVNLDVLHVTSNPSAITNSILGYGGLVPVGWVATSYLNAGYMGCLVCPLAIGFFGAKLESFLSTTSYYRKWWHASIYIIGYYVWTSLLLVGEQTSIALTTITLLVLIILLRKNTIICKI
jgi:hypothetical protein